MEDLAMSEFIGGINPVGPSYPIIPTQKSNKDKEPGKHRPQHEKQQPEPQDDDEQQPHIDELV
jgi:hypothetical protein